MPAPPRTITGPRRLLPCGGWSLALIAVIWVAIACQLYGQREAAIAAARASAAGLADAYADAAARGLSDIEQTLLYARALHARDGAALDLAPWVNSAELATRAVLPIRMTDRDGMVTLSDLHRPSQPGEPVDLSQQPDIRHFATAAPLVDRLFIGAPTRASGRWSVTFARALMTPQGAFDGVVSVALDPATLLPAMPATGPGGAVTLTGLDGIVLASSGAGPPAGEASATPAIGRAATEADGGYEWRDPADGVRRIAGFRRVEGFPLLVDVALGRDAVLAGLRDSLIVLPLAGLLLSAAVGVGGATARRRASRMTETQSVLFATLEYFDRGVIVVDPDGRIAVLNCRAAELLDLPGRFKPGERFSALVDWQRREREFQLGEPPVVLPHLMAASLAQSAPRCYRRTRPNGVVLEVRILTLAEGWTMCTYRDVTPAEPAKAMPGEPVPSGDPAPVAHIVAEPIALVPSPVDHLAVEHLSDTLGSDAVAGIVATFLDVLPRQLGRMRGLAEVGDTDPLQREAHALAGSAGMLGLDELGAAASELEEDLKWRRLGATSARLERIDRLATTGLDRLANYLSNRAA